jgi:fucose permease
MSARRPGVVLLLLAACFVVSVVTNTLGPLIPEIIAAFHLSLAEAGLLPFAFFIAYGVASIPAGLWIERSSEKRVIVAAFLLAFTAAVSFAVFPRYRVAVGSLFAMGFAMAAVQVALNPLLRVAGGEAEFAFFSTLAQLVFGVGSFLGPRLYALLVEEGGAGPVVRTLRRAGGALPWTSVYWVLAALAAAMVVLVGVAPLPRVDRRDDERAGSLAAHRALLGGGVVPRYFVSIFMYVGSEQGVASWLSQFLALYHGVHPRTGGAAAVSWFWGGMTVGCLFGLVLLKLVDSRRVLVLNAAVAIVLLALGLFGDAGTAAVALPAIGLVASVMWPIIFSLALNSVTAHHGAVSGILCTAVVGGAIVPLVVGRIGDRLGLRAGMALLFLTFGWVLGVGLWARPLVKNETRS